LACESAWEQFETIRARFEVVARQLFEFTSAAQARKARYWKPEAWDEWNRLFAEMKRLQGDYEKAAEDFQQVRRQHR
jgi:hypothetical protein